MGFMDLEKAYNRDNREALWQVLRKYDVGGKLLSGIESMYVNILACVREKGGESEWFRVDSSEMKDEKIGMGRRGESGDCLASCMQMTWFCVMSQRKN